MARVDAATGPAWPGRPRATASRVRADAAVAVCCANVAAVVFLQRIVVPLGGERAVSCLLPLAWLSVAYLLRAGLAAVDPGALLACLVFFAAVLASQILGGTDFSTTSLALLLAIYALLPVKIGLSRHGYRRVLRFYQSCLVLVALATVGQYASQLLGLGMPVLEGVVPEVFIAQNFVYLQEIVWQSGIYKPNGIVMLEASFLSQFIGLALAIEFWIFRRPAMVLLFGCMLVLTFSGTGMSLAAVALAAMVWKRGWDRNASVLAGAVVCAVLVLLVTGWFQAIGGRVAEFSDRDASASVRFVAPFVRVHETLAAGDLVALFWGAGAGFIDREIGFAWLPAVKMWVEYGLVASVAYWAFLAVLARPAPSATLAFVLALWYLLFGGGALLQPPVVFGCYFLGIGYKMALAAEPVLQPYAKARADSPPRPFRAARRVVEDA